MEQKYKMRVVRGAFNTPSLLDELGAKTIEKLERSEWQSIDEIIVDLKHIKELQKNMVRHYDDVAIPWYMDGYSVQNKKEIIVAFGADDGEDGKIFQLMKDDKKAMDEAIEYGISRGIPKEQMDFMDVDF